MTQPAQQKTPLRVLHSAALLSPPSGIVTQMQWEQDAANALGIAWRVAMYGPKNSANHAAVSVEDPRIDAQSLKNPGHKLLAWVQLRQRYHQWLLAQQDAVDVFVLRHYVHDPFQYAFIRRCKRPVYLVHHTREVPELALPGGAVGFIRSRLERWLGGMNIRAAKGIIGVTQEIVDDALRRSHAAPKPSHLYANGIVFKEFVRADRRNASIPELLFVANFAPWHGVDVLLEEVAKSQDAFVLHLVGAIPDGLEALLQDPRIRVYGKLSHAQITQLGEQCWIGLSSFALARKQMKQACPLKAREYWMLGLPVYGDYEEVLPAATPSQTLYYQQGTERIADILRFAHQMRAHSKEVVSRTMRPCIDKIALLARLYQDLCLDAGL